MSPKLELAFGLLILVASVAGLRVTFLDIRRGVTSFTPKFGTTKTFSRSKSPFNFWQVIIFYIVASVVGLTLGGLGLFEGISHF